MAACAPTDTIGDPLVASIINDKELAIITPKACGAWVSGPPGRKCGLFRISSIAASRSCTITRRLRTIHVCSYAGGVFDTWSVSSHWHGAAFNRTDTWSETKYFDSWFDPVIIPTDVGVFDSTYCPQYTSGYARLDPAWLECFPDALKGSVYLDGIMKLIPGKFLDLSKLGIGLHYLRVNLNLDPKKSKEKGEDRTQIFWFKVNDDVRLLTPLTSAIAVPGRPVSFSIQTENLTDNTTSLIFNAKLPKGWKILWVTPSYLELKKKETNNVDFFIIPSLKTRPTIKPTIIQVVAEVAHGRKKTVELLVYLNKNKPKPTYISIPKKLEKELDKKFKQSGKLGPTIIKETKHSLAEMCCEDCS